MSLGDVIQSEEVLTALQMPRWQHSLLANTDSTRLQRHIPQILNSHPSLLPIAPTPPSMPLLWP